MAVVTPDLPQIFEEAYERAGVPFRGGYQLRSIRNSLNILLLEWQNRGLNLFTIQSGTQALTAGTASYTMPTDTIDLIEYQIRSGSGTGQTDSALTRISVSDYAQTTNKNTTGRPTEIYIQRTATAVTVTLWPVPDSSSYSLAYYRLVGIDGVSSGVGTTAAIPPRFIPPLVAGLAFYTSMKEPEAAARAELLKAYYEEQFMLASEEDREKATFRFIPWAAS